MAETGSAFHFDHERYTAACALPPEHIPDFMRLVKNIRFGSRFQFLVAEYNDVPYRDLLIQQLDSVSNAEGLRPARLDVSQASCPDFAGLETAMLKLSENHQMIHVVDNDDWFDAVRWEAFNIRREAVAQSIPLRLVFWLRPEHIRQLAILAPDLWAWRGGVFSFATHTSSFPQEMIRHGDSIDSRSLAERSKRIAELRNYLKAEPPPADDIRLPLLDELAELLRSLGQLGEALRIRQEDQLPVYQRLGDVRSVAVTQGRIADILQALGQPDEALRILKDQLTVFQNLGEAPTVSYIQGRISDILLKLGRV